MTRVTRVTVGSPVSARSADDASGVGARPGGVGSVVLDVDAWALLLASVPGDVAAAVPPRFAAAPDLLADPVAVVSSRQVAGDRLRALGWMDDEGRPTDAAVGVVGVWRAAPVKVSVRAWSGDRTVLVEAAAGAAGVVALTRLERVDEAPQGRTVRPGLGVEVAVFPLDRLLDRVWRAVPPVMRDATPAVDRVASDGAAAAGDVPVAVLEVMVCGSGAAPGKGWTSHGTWVTTSGGLFAVQPATRPGVPSAPDGAGWVATDGRGLLADLLRTLAAAVRVTVVAPSSRDGGRRD